MQAALKEAGELRRRDDTHELWRLLDQLSSDISWVDEPERQPLISQVTEMLSWAEVGLSPGDRSAKSIALRILARYGDENVVPAIEAFAEKTQVIVYTNEDEKRNRDLRECDQRSAKHAIEVIRHPGGRQNHPLFHHLDLYI